MTNDKRLLKANEIEIRVGNISEKMVKFLLYKDARCDRNILNELYGKFGWQSSFERKGEQLFCKISVFDEKTNQWISKEDCGIESQQTDNNKYKAEASDAFKRACYQWGIGEELYTMKNMVLYGEGYTQEKKTSKGKYELKKEYDYLDVVDVEYNNDNEIESVVVENSCNKITFFRSKKAVVEVKKKTIEKQSANNKGVPVDIATIDEILLKIPSKKGWTVQQIYDYCDKKNWYGEKSNKPITAQTIKLFLEKGWL